MSKLTLLEIVQDVLNDLNSDQVAGVNDTVESTQIAQIAKTVYFDLMEQKKWPHLNAMFTLDNPSNTSMVVAMLLPENVKHVDKILYNSKLTADADDLWKEIKYLHPDEFIEHVSKFKSSASTTTTYSLFVENAGGEVVTNVSLMCQNNRAPTHYTSFDDSLIVFDAFDSNLDTRIIASKTQVYGERTPSWSHTSSSVPDLPAKSFPMYLSEVKSKAFVVLNQEANAKEEQNARRHRYWQSREKWRVNGGIRFPHYGRK